MSANFQVSETFLSPPSEVDGQTYGRSYGPFRILASKYTVAAAGAAVKKNRITVVLFRRWCAHCSLT